MIADISPSTVTIIVALIAGAGTGLGGFLTYLKSKKTDTSSAYSQVVKDLGEDIARQRTERTEDRMQWAADKAEAKANVAQQRKEDQEEVEHTRSELAKTVEKTRSDLEAKADQVEMSSKIFRKDALKKIEEVTETNVILKRRVEELEIQIAAQDLEIIRLTHLGSKASLVKIEELEARIAEQLIEISRLSAITVDVAKEDMTKIVGMADTVQKQQSDLEDIRSKIIPDPLRRKKPGMP